MATWGIAKAKAQLSDVVYQAEKTGPQTLTRSGRDVAVVVSIEEWRRLHESGGTHPRQSDSMGDYLLSSPLNGSRLNVAKLNWRMPRLDL